MPNVQEERRASDACESIQQLLCESLCSLGQQVLFEEIQRLFLDVHHAKPGLQLNRLHQCLFSALFVCASPFAIPPAPLFFFRELFLPGHVCLLRGKGHLGVILARCGNDLSDVDLSLARRIVHAYLRVMQELNKSNGVMLQAKLEDCLPLGLDADLLETHMLAFSRQLPVLV